MTLDELNDVMKCAENEHIEFKEAKEQIDTRDVIDYCVALANEGGGNLILGVSNKKPRRIVGSKACRNIHRIKESILAALRCRVEIHEIHTSDGRVVVITIPSRPVGQPLHHNGRYLMRSGESLVPMTADRLKAIFDEVKRDFSAEICRRATVDDLDNQTLARFRRMWANDSGREEIGSIPDEQLLRDSELLTDEGITFAALILFGTNNAFGKHLSNGELTYEYRSDRSAIEPDFRRDFREGFFHYLDELWAVIDARNTVAKYQFGIIKREIPMFRETVVREAILNSVAHRDYQDQGTIRVCQSPNVLEITSPGGFPPGIDEKNILYSQKARNLLVATALEKCGLVERAGQGVDIMYRACIRDSKSPPDYSGTDGYQVKLTLRGDVRDTQFIRFLETVAEERQQQFDTGDLVVLDLVKQDQPIPKHLKSRLSRLVDDGIVERIGRGRGVRHILSRGLYRFVGREGAYTRRRGLDRDTNKALLVRHIEANERDGCRLQELQEVLPSLSRSQIQVLLRELRQDGRIHSVGKTRSGRWFSGPAT